MTSTQAPQDPGNQKPDHESFHGRNPCETTPKSHPGRGFVHIHALAFSTLLSSQETDTHHQEALASSPGQPLNLTPKYP